MNAPIVVVEDDSAVGRVVLGLLKKRGHAATLFPSAEAALAHLRTHDASLVLTDLRLGGHDGLWLLGEIARETPGLPVVLMTAHGSIPLAVEAMRRGAKDFITKPFSEDEIAFVVDKALAQGSERAPSGASGLEGASPAIEGVRALIARVAKTNASVLLLGESGTGKEVAARSIHAESPRKDGPFVAVHCAALPESLLESELFGHEKGAFSGAVGRKPGRFELAHGGTLFLDEMGDIPLSMQVKLLRVLQEREFNRVGGTEPVTVDVRVVAATHRDLQAMVDAGTFRQDLFYRLNVVPITLPRLADRAGDVALLARTFLERFSREHGRPGMRFTTDAIAVLEGHAFPGNVRELSNFVERLVVLSDKTEVDAEDVRTHLANGRTEGRPSTPPSSGKAAPLLADSRADAERVAILQALQKSGNNRTLAARVLGVSRRTLYNRIATLGID
jgi:DNA-binding NtrC family response regulator